MTKTKTSLLLLFLLITSVMFAQEKSVSGRVISSKDNTPLASVTVGAKGTTAKVTSSDDGSFTINVPAQATALEFSFIGYKAKEVSLSGISASVVVSLDEDPMVLSDVVVTALGVTRRVKSLTFASQNIKTADIKEVRDANILNTLQGKIAGAAISQGSGGVGGASRIVLRGNRSLGNNNALIVVDGVPINNSVGSSVSSDFGGVTTADGISNINPDDIESINVLRGANGAALYGSAAANGVIVITTKKGRNEKFSVSINSGVTTESVFALPSFQNSYGQGIGGVINSSQGASWGEKLNGQSYTNFLGVQSNYSAQPDNVKDFFYKPVTFNNSVAVSGGSAKMQSYLSYSNYNGSGIIPRNKIDRHTVNLRITNQITSKFSTDAKITYITQEIKNTPLTGETNAPVIDIYQIPRNVSITEARNYEILNNVGVPIPVAWPSTLSSIYQNPYWAVNKVSINQSRDRVIGFITARYDISTWLSLQGKLNIDKSYNKESTSAHSGTLIHAGTRGSYRESSSTPVLKWFDFTVSGRGKLNNNFSLDYQAGAILQDTKNRGISGTANGLIIPNRFFLQFATQPRSFSSFSHEQTQSLFAHANVAFKDYLFLDASIRNDWSSTLPSPHSFAYPSVGLAAIISDMAKLPDFISFLKLNTSYAQVGNATSAYQLLTQNSFSPAPGFPSGTGFIAQDVFRATETLKPEKTKSIELGGDIRFFNDRLGLNLSYYKTNSINQIISISTPQATGFFGQRINTGDIQNKGFEIVLTASPVLTKNFRWDVLFNYGANRNKVVSIYETVKQITVGGSTRAATTVFKEGEPFGELYGTGWRKDVKGNLLVDANGLPLGSASLVRVGNFNPRATLGLSNSISFKNFSLRVLIDGRVGGEVVSGTEMNLAFSGITKATEENRTGNWVLPGLNPLGNKNEVPINAEKYWTSVSGKRAGKAEFFTFDQTNFRIREASLAYTLPKLKFVKEARVSVFARNLLWLYRGSNKLKVPGMADRKLPFDPDMNLGIGNFQGVDYGVMPSTRSIGVNFQVTL